MEIRSVLIIVLYLVILRISVISANTNILETYPVDLTRYRYFTNDPVVPPLSVFQRAKAIGKYFNRVIFGSPSDMAIRPFVFDPQAGLKWRAAYRKQFGYRGENLVALLGRGASREELIYYGAIRKEQRY